MTIYYCTSYSWYFIRTSTGSASCRRPICGKEWMANIVWLSLLGARFCAPDQKIRNAATSSPSMASDVAPMPPRHAPTVSDLPQRHPPCLRRVPGAVAHVAEEFSGAGARGWRPESLPRDGTNSGSQDSRSSEPLAVSQSMALKISRASGCSNMYSRSQW